MEQNEFARAADIPIPSLKKWVGAASPNLRRVNVVRLSKALKVPEADVQAVLTSSRSPGKNGAAAKHRIGSIVAGRPLDPPIVREVPIINRIAAGPLTERTDLDYPAGFADDYVRMAIDAGTEAFGLWVEGESMLPRYEPGDLVVFRALKVGERIVDGKDYAIQLNEEAHGASTFKRVTQHSKLKNTIVATALNPEFEPRAQEIPMSRVARLGHVMVIIPGNR